MPIQHAIWQVGAQPTLLASSKLVSETTLGRVTTVSVETVRIVAAMKGAVR